MNRNQLRLGPGSQLYWELPAESIRFTVLAKGFQPQEIFATIEPARIVKARVTLQPSK